MGAWALHNDGTIGFVTCGHGWKEGSNAYYGSTLIGRNASIVKNSKVDAAFFEKTSNMAWGGYLNGNYLDLVSNPRVNDKVTLLGARGTKSGQVKYIDISGRVADDEVDSIAVSDMFCFNFQPIVGDSGGAIIAQRSGTDVLVGINRSKWFENDDSNNGFTWGAGCKSFNIENAMNFSFANAR